MTKETRPNLLEGLLIKGALAVEDRLDQRMTPPSPFPRKSRRWLVGTGVVALGGATLAVLTGKVGVPEPRSQTVLKPTEKPIEVFPLKYGVGISTENFHIQDETQGLEIDVDTKDLANITGKEHLGFTLPKDSMVGAIIIPYLSSIMDEANYERDFVGISSKSNPNRKFTRVFTIEFYKTLTEVFLQGTGPETINRDLSVALSLKWAERIRYFVDQANPNVHSPGLTEEAKAVIRNRPPIRVTSVSQQVIREALNMFGPVVTTEKDGTQVRLNHVAYVKLNNGIIYSEVEGLDLVVYKDLMLRFDSRLATQIPLAPDQKLVTVILPITNDPEEMEKARVEFEQKKLDKLMKDTYKDENYKPVLNIIPLYQILWEAYDTKKPDEKYDGIRYNYFVYSFIIAYYQAAGKNVNLSDFDGKYPFNPISIKPELVEKALVTVRAQKAKTPTAVAKESPTISSFIEKPLYENTVIIIENEAFYNSVPGAIFAISPETVKTMNSRKDTQRVNPAKPQVFVLAPVRDNPTDIEVEKASYKTTQLSILRANSNFTEDPEVTIIPVLEVLENSKREAKNPTDPINFTDHSYFISQYYMGGRNPNSAVGIKLAGSMRPIRVKSLDPFLINRLLESKRPH